MRIRLWLALFTLSGTAALASAGVIPTVPHVPASVLNPEAEPMESSPADPAEIADRIAAKTKEVGDRLRDLDTGSDTRKSQDQILKDIDELLKQAQNPPPMPMGGGGSSNSSNSQQNRGDSSSSPSNSEGNSGKSPPSSNGNSPGNGKPPMGGSKNSPGSQSSGDRGGWRDRVQQASAGEKPMGGQTQPGGSETKPGGDSSAKNTNPGAKPEPKQPGESGGIGEPKKPSGNDGGLGGTSRPGMPLDDAVTKQVWGHLPERLRQQMTQYYREQFVSKYGDLLRDYYSSLAEREKLPKNR